MIMDAKDIPHAGDIFRCRKCGFEMRAVADYRGRFGVFFLCCGNRMKKTTDQDARNAFATKEEPGVAGD